MMISKRRIAAALAVALAASAFLAGAAHADGAEDPVALVNPLIGTLNEGTTVPAANVPFGMVQLGPDTEQLSYAAYKYDDPSILGFAQAHLSGVGCQTMGVVRTMPTTSVPTSNATLFRSPFSHENETAQPGYYRVLLDKYGVVAELTADTRTGFHRYTFPSTTMANVQFEVGLANGNTYGADVHVVGDDTIEGSVKGGNFCSETSTDRYTVYFSAKFNRPFAGFGTWTGNLVLPTFRDQSATSQTAIGAYAQFDTSVDNVVEVAVGLSYTGVEGARQNREQESTVTGGDGPRPRTFDEVRQAAQAAWRGELGRVAVDGGSPDDRAVFYTALYHALWHPSVATDVDGGYRGFDGANHVAEGWTYYQHFSLWDTYRTQNMLVSLLYPSRARDMMRSLLRIRAEAGWLPRWALATGETNVMSGDPVTAFLADGASKGLLSGLENEAWDALWQNVNEKPVASQLQGGQRIRGRDGNDTYTLLGWVGYKTTSGYLYGDERQAGSATLEYALSDCSLSRLATSLGKTQEAAVLRGRAQSYRNLWDSSIVSQGFTGFPRARTSAGAWVGSTDPATTTGFHEGTPWQYQWLVPQDVEGLFGLMGGQAAAAARLDEFFSLATVIADPYRAAHEDWVVGAYAYNNALRYNPNNEPDLHVPWLYAWTGQAWKTSAVVRAAQTLFVNQPNGMTGNDDLGEMSAWYVFSALGIYPVMSGASTYVFNAPRFESAVVRLENGRTLTISAPGAAGGLQYIQDVHYDGAELPQTWIDHARLADGGTLDFVVADGTPPDGAPLWGADVAAQPVSLCGSATPTAVTVHAFKATRHTEGVLLRWRTATEVGILGFDVVRSGGGRTLKLNRTRIPAKAGGSATSATYRLLDRHVRRGVTYTYRLRAVSEGGGSSWAATAVVGR